MSKSAVTGARLSRHRLALLVAAAAALADGRSAAAGGGSPSPEDVPGLRYRFEKAADGVFCAIPSGTPYVVSNSVVVVGRDGILLVDPGTSPGQAKVLREAIRGLGVQPVRYVVDTHFHFDHAFGNAAFAEALIVGHRATRELLGPDALAGRTVAGNLSGLPARIEKSLKDAAEEADPAKRSELERQAASLSAYRRELLALAPVPPQLTFEDRMTLWLGGREIRLLHPGRAHTAGDVLVYLPQERVLASGDFFNGYVGYLGDAYVDEWADSLERLAALDFETVVPGHGAPFKGKERIAPVQGCLRDLWRQAEMLRRTGTPAEVAAARIDLRAHAASFPRFAQVGIEPLAVQRIYQVIDGRTRGPHQP